MKETDLFWLAGILEGEGTFTFNVYHDRYATIHIVVSMSDEDVILRCYTVSGIGTVSGPYYDKRAGHWKPLWKWQVTKRVDAVDLLHQVYPYMGRRRQQQIAACLETDHLYPHQERAQHQRNKTHCPHGHPYSGENLILEKNGQRHCRTCRRARDKQRKR